MADVKHTPGPWTSYPCNLERYSRVITANGAMVQIAYTGLNHHDQVAMTKEVYGDRRTYGPGEETTANARLISAAPDLLDALIAAQTVLRYLPDMTTNWGGERETMSTRQAEARVIAAIAKATGAARATEGSAT